MTPNTPPKQKRVVNVVRVSRQDDDAISPGDQRAKLVGWAERERFTVVDTLEEPNISGGAPLEKRHGLLRAIELMEAGKADIIAVAYFDRLVRSLEVQAEIFRRVENAEGSIVALDVGEVRADTPALWLSSTMHGMVAQYHRLVTADRAEAGKRDAVAKGIPPFPQIPPGLRQREDRTLEPDPETAPIIVRAFEQRAAGTPVREIRSYLRAHGIDRSYHGVRKLLASPMYIGELHFGERFVNRDSHDPIVSEELWRRVQRMTVPRGPRPDSDRLLARLGILHCATCGGKMAIGSTTHKGKLYPFYRCSPTLNDCPQRVAISAPLAEEIVFAKAKELAADAQGRASQDDPIRDAEAAVAAAVERRSKLMKILADFESIAEAREQLRIASETVDRARDHLDDIRTTFASEVIIDLDDLKSVESKRALIRAVIATATVAPGRGASRITIEPRL